MSSGFLRNAYLSKLILAIACFYLFSLYILVKAVFDQSFCIEYKIKGENGVPNVSFREINYNFLLNIRSFVRYEAGIHSLLQK